MKNNTDHRIKILDDLYLSVLGREADDEGIRMYLPYVHKPNGLNRIRTDLMRSKEYKKVQYPKLPNIIINNGKTKEYSSLNLKNQNVLLLSLIKDCSYNIHHLKNIIHQLGLFFNNVNYYYLTNNNTDSTDRELLRLKSELPNNIDGIHLKNEQIRPITKNKNPHRTQKFATYRNILIKESINRFGSNFDYIIMLDADFATPPDVAEIVKSISINDSSWSYISGNYCYNNSDYYYDSFALRLHDDPQEIEKIYPLFSRYYSVSHHWIDKLYKFSNWIDVSCAFGGICIYKAKEIYELYHQNNNIYDTDITYSTCEHISLSNKLKNKKYINSNLYFQSLEKLSTMSNDSYAFIPRDAGFFSVFNFLIGSISSGYRAYPNFNKQKFTKYNRGNPKHFCYWTTNTNSWMDFFEPIQYYQNDLTHTDQQLGRLPVINGSDIASKEFTHPEHTKSLFTNISKFNKWRYDTNQIYQSYIKIKEDIINEVKYIIQNIKDKNTQIIGVHYRHPSHSVESGDIYLQQYFDAINEILVNNPEAQIFIASDTEFGILAFQKEYGDRLHYIENIERLNLDNILAWAYAMKQHKKSNDVGFINNKGYELQHIKSSENHVDNYKMTKDLLLEVLCLSECNYLIHTISNIALTISYINPSITLKTLI